MGYKCPFIKKKQYNIFFRRVYIYIYIYIKLYIKYIYLFRDNHFLIGELMEVVQNGGKSQQSLKTFYHGKCSIVNLEDRRRLLKTQNERY